MKVPMYLLFVYLKKKKNKICQKSQKNKLNGNVQKIVLL